MDKGAINIQVNIRPITFKEMNWVNAIYRAIHFVESNYQNEFILIAELDGEKAGLGRLVQVDNKNIELGGIYVFPDFRKSGIASKIVTSLCEQNPYSDTRIWCLPFENLGDFYLKFGFDIHTTQPVPEKVLQKHKWCNEAGRYEEAVLLLCK